MIKLAQRLYCFIAILSPFIFLALRLSGHYNFVGKNSFIFLGLFALSTFTLIMTKE